VFIIEPGKCTYKKLSTKPWKQVIIIGEIVTQKTALHLYDLISKNEAVKQTRFTEQFFF
jgi:hypothetical protein